MLDLKPQRTTTQPRTSLIDGQLVAAPPFRLSDFKSEATPGMWQHVFVLRFHMHGQNVIVLLHDLCEADKRAVLQAQMQQLKVQHGPIHSQPSVLAG